jgi:hypothetical protein
MSDIGGFLVIRDDGHYWDGDGWTRDVRHARFFTNPPDAYADCALAVSCLRKLREACEVAYVPRGRGSRRTGRTVPPRS